jgi:hypothetical protein
LVNQKKYQHFGSFDGSAMVKKEFRCLTQKERVEKENQTNKTTSVE